MLSPSDLNLYPLSCPGRTVGVIRFHKTFKEARKTYSYEFVISGGDRQTVTIIPGRDGVTEVDIKRLHNMDDSEVDGNLEAWRIPRTEEQKRDIEAWVEEYCRLFADRYGYEPCKADLKAIVKAKFPTLWNVSIDEIEENLGDKFTAFSNETETRENQFQDAIEIRIGELLGGLSAREKDIYRLVVKEDCNCTEAGKALGISDSYVSRVMKKIRAILRDDRILQKFYGVGSDSDEKDPLKIQEDTDES